MTTEAGTGTGEKGPEKTDANEKTAAEEHATEATHRADELAAIKGTQ